MVSIKFAFFIYPFIPMTFDDDSGHFDAGMPASELVKLKVLCQPEKSR